MKINEYRLFIAQLAQARDAMDSIVIYRSWVEKADTALRAKEKEIVRKEGVIVRTLDQRNNCYNGRDNLLAQMKEKDNIIEKHADNIKRLGRKPKYWGLGIVAGYGYSLGQTITRAPFIGVAVYRQLVRF